MDNYEKELFENNVKYIAGVDEVGRGPLIGPVVSACVVLPKNINIDKINDSKKLSEKTRNQLYEKIQKEALGIGVGIIDNNRIDEINIYNATKESMKEAINNCLKSIKIEHILIDAMKLDLSIPSTSIIKGDQKSYSIAAASIVAKVIRDKIMYDLDLKHNEYEFKNNKGYPTKKHVEAIKKHGILKEHRKTFGIVKEYVNIKS